MLLRKEFLSNCRFCLGRLVPFDQVEIDKDISEQFYEVTNVNLKLSEEYSNYSCSRCLHDLKTFQLIRKKFLETQIFLDNDCVGEEKDEKIGNVEALEEQVVYDPNYSSFEVEESLEIEAKEEVQDQATFVDCFEVTEVEDEKDNTDYLIIEEEIYTKPLNEVQDEDNQEESEDVNCIYCNSFVPADSLAEHIEAEHPENLNFDDSSKGQQSPNSTDDIQVFGSKSGSEVQKYRSFLAVSDKNDAKCPACNQQFRTKVLRDSHVKSMHPDESVFECYFLGCEKVFESVTGLENHRDQAHRNTDREVLKVQIDKLRDLHLIKVDKKLVVICPACSGEFSKEAFRRHYENVHLKIKFYKCDICDKEFYYRNRLSDHLKTHFAIKDHACMELECGKKFTSSQALFMHKNIYHTKKFARTCDLCGKQFHTKSYYDTHMRAKHTGERTYFCDFPECPKAFFSSSEVNSHKKRVHAERVLCTVCNKTFACPYSLKKHMKYHDEKKFVCTELDEYGEKCGKKFVEKHFLNTHIKLSHKKVREFVCPACGVCYTNNSDLKNHVKNIHEKMRIKCELCGSLIGAKSYYRRHILAHHKDLDDQTRDELLEKIKNTKFEDLFTHVVVKNLPNPQVYEVVSVGVEESS